jgi:hypothetical protein
MHHSILASGEASGYFLRLETARVCSLALVSRMLVVKISVTSLGERKRALNGSARNSRNHLFPSTDKNCGGVGNDFIREQVRILPQRKLR